VTRVVRKTFTPFGKVLAYLSLSRLYKTHACSNTFSVVVVKYDERLGVYPITDVRTDARTNGVSE